MKNLYKPILLSLFIGLYLCSSGQKSSSISLWNNLFFGGGKILVEATTINTTDSVWLAFGFIDMHYRKTVVGDSLVITSLKRQKIVLQADSTTMPRLESATFGIKTWFRWYYFKLHKNELESLKNSPPKKIVFCSQPYVVEKEVVRDRNLDEESYKLYLKNAEKSRVVKFNRITGRSKKRFSKLMVQLL